MNPTMYDGLTNYQGEDNWYPAWFDNLLLLVMVFVLSHVVSMDAGIIIFYHYMIDLGYQLSMVWLYPELQAAMRFTCCTLL